MESEYRNALFYSAENLDRGRYKKKRMYKNGELVERAKRIHRGWIEDGCMHRGQTGVDANPIMSSERCVWTVCERRRGRRGRRIALWYASREQILDFCLLWILRKISRLGCAKPPVDAGCQSRAKSYPRWRFFAVDELPGIIGSLIIHGYLLFPQIFMHLRYIDVSYLCV